MRKRSELFFNLLLLPLDFIFIVTSFVLAYIIRVKLDGRPVHYPIAAAMFLKIFLVILPIWILIFALLGLYNMSSQRGRLDELGKLFIGVSGGVMGLIVIDFLSRQPIFPSKSIPIYGYAISFVLVVFGRSLIRRVQRFLFNYNIGVHNTLLIGSGPLAQDIYDQLFFTGRTGYRIIGVVDTAKSAARRFTKVPVFTSFDQALSTFGRRGIDEIIQADSALDPDQVMELVSYASNNHLTYRFVPNQFGLFATNSSVSNIAGMPMIEIRQTPLDGWGRILKRIFDLVGAAAGLVLLAPVFLVTAIIIKLSDPGPVFYKHKRLSRAGTTLYLYKFRTMLAAFSTGQGFSGKTDAQIFAELGKPELAKEFAKEQKLADDPRVSKFGKFLRKSSIDELPQLINVLRGNLSLVGPRPIVEAELERYGDGQATFLSLKPGVTGLWQISGRSDIGYEERVKLDIYYVENWSLLLDIKILLKTIGTIFSGRGAY